MKNAIIMAAAAATVGTFAPGEGITKALLAAGTVFITYFILRAIDKREEKE